MRYIICAIAKNENEYIIEWIKYHLKLGFQHIYIYDNNDIDGEVIDAIITPDIAGDVTIINVRGQSCMQRIVYNECYREQVFDWCAFIDIDEFITFNPSSGCTTIDEFMKDKQMYEAIHLNWLCFGDGGLIYQKSGNIVERFVEPIHPLNFRCVYDFPENYHIKSIIKSGLCIDWDSFLWESNPHTPWGLNSIGDGKGNKIEVNSPFNPYNYEVAYIRHYVTKTIDEYVVKIIRQCADTQAIFYSFSKFYRYNNLTFKKLIHQYKLIRKYHLKGFNNSIVGTLYKYIKFRYHLISN